MSRIPARMRHVIVACREADVRFFQRRPDRRHRVRLAAHAEVALARAEGSITAPLPAGVRGFVAVARQPDEALAWVIGFAGESAETDLDEPTARAAFQRFQAHDDSTLRDYAARAQTGGADA